MKKPRLTKVCMPPRTKGEPQKATSIRVADSLIELFEKYAEEDRRSRNFIIEEAMRQYVERRGPPKEAKHKK